MEALVHWGAMTARILRQLMRQPLYIIITLAQPLVWLLLYGPLFHRIASIPGFPATSYVTYLTPGIVIMSALFSSGMTGLGVLGDIDSGIMERFLSSPAQRFSLVVGRLAATAVTIIIQAYILLFLGWLLGARYGGGFTGILLIIFPVLILGMGFGGFSIALAVRVRRQESVIGSMNLLLLPLTFLSGAFMSTNLIPHWMQAVARVNPINWAIELARLALTNELFVYGSLVKFTLLTMFAIANWFLVGWTFRSYQTRI